MFHRGNVVKSAEGLFFTPGQGEDVVYVIKNQFAEEIGLINGEEGLRGRFSHSIFESRLEDNELICRKRPAKTMIDPTAPIRSSRDPLPVKCLE